MGMGLVCERSCILDFLIVGCKPSEFLFEASRVSFEDGNVSLGTWEGSNDYDRLKFCSWK